MFPKPNLTPFIKILKLQTKKAMSNLLRQFIKKKILTNQKIKEFSASKSPSDFNDLKTPLIHSFHPSEKSNLRSPMTKSRNAVYYEDRDKKMERTEHDLLDFKKKMIEFYFSLKNWILLDQVCKSSFLKFKNMLLK